jgi:hypothetical protein
MDNKIVADEMLLAKVRGVTAPATLCDADGNPVAVVIPPDLYRGLLSSWSESRYQPELAERAWQDYLKNGGSSTADILAMLRALEGTPDAKS